ncbi:MAG: SsrA-binding protein SmpB [bacterium]
MTKKIFAKNKRAYHDYKVLESFEAGVSLLGQEVKSIKEGSASLKESFVSVDDGQMWLWNCHVPQWRFSSDKVYDPIRKRQLLMKRAEIDTLLGKTKAKNLSLIPLSLYGFRGIIKVEVGLCQGLKKYDKRKRLKEREMVRDLQKDKRSYMV